MSMTALRLERASAIRQQRGTAIRRVGIAALAGAAVGAAAIYWRRRAQKAEQDNPPLGQFVAVGVNRLHYVECGRGEPAIVILHGNGSMLQDILGSGLIERLAPSHRVVVFDRPGFGHSPRSRGGIWTAGAQARAVREAFDQLGLYRPVLVGHSWGTLVALALALRYPAAVRSLVLISGYYNPTFRLDVPLLAPPGLPVIGPLLRWSISPLIARLTFPAMIRRLFAPGPVPDRFRAAFPRELALRPSQIAASGGATGLMIPMAAFYRRRYGQLAVPALVVAGRADRVIDPIRQSARVAQQVPRGSLHLVPGGGHMVHYQEPDTIATIIKKAATAH
jgi:pimeloyl-ACP methyl ester carboxylesterase